MWRGGLSSYAQDGEDGRALADPAGVLVHGNIEYVMNPVFHPPVTARRSGVICGAVAVPGRCIPCDVAGEPPVPAGGDILMQNRAGDANRLDGVDLPVRQVQNAACLEHLDHALFPPVTPYFV